MIGRTLGHYRITERLGEGGMGVVYKAQDLHLDRPVALKVLPPDKLADPDRRQRFTQEAKAASALNHPNIITIHDIASEGGVDFIAMEYVAGKTLDQVIPRHGMRLNQLLKCAVQMADALAAAHDAGIVHRDVKPGNVMVGEKGQIKVLDFGLAKLTEAVPLGDEEPTRTVKPATEEGTIVGTVAYMSPEQAEGKKVDARSDIFSLGSVLYELVTGQQPFQGPSRLSTLSAILQQEPKAPSTIAPAIPPELERLISRCLRKDPAKRFQHMDDIKVALEELKEESDSGKLAGAPITRRTRSWRWVWAVAGAAVLVLGALLIWLFRAAPLPSDLRPVVLTSYSGVETEPSFSPDGSKVAFSWNGEKGDNYDIYIKQIGVAGTPMPLTKDPAAERSPAWSPDDRWIAFIRGQQGSAAVMLIPPLGGPERKLAEAQSFSGLCWTPNGKWLVVGTQDRTEGPPTASIWAIAIASDERHRLTNLPVKSGAAEHLLGDSSPAVSPDGRTLAFARAVSSYVYELYAVRLTPDLQPDGEPWLVTDQRYATVRGIAWAANGREILYAAGGVGVQALWRATVSGRQAPQRLPYALPAIVYPAIARMPPRLAYSYSVNNVNLWRLDVRTGERREHIGSTFDSRIADYSPDGRKIAFQSNRSGNLEVWTCDADGSSDCTQLTSFNGPQCGSPRWSPDGKWLALDSRSEGQPEVYVMAADGGQPRRMTNHPANDIIPSWSADGQWIYFASDRSGQFELWKVPKDGGEAVRITRDGGYRSHASQNGRYIYYTKGSRTKQGIFRMPVEGGEETQVLPTTSTFDVTAEGLYFFVGPGFRVINRLDLATGKISTVATLDKTGSGLTVSPDEAFIVWFQRDRATVDLMLVENFR